MKKLLRLSFIALMTMVANVAMAEDILWQEDFSSYAANDVPAGGTYNYVCTDGASDTKIYKEALAQGTSPELLIGKKTASVEGGTFTATIALGGKSGDFGLQFKANAATRIEVTSSTTGVTVEKDGGDNIYKITVPSGTASLSLTFKNINTSNVRFDDVKLYQGSAKLPAGLSWGTSTRTVTLGADNNTFPTLTNPHQLPVTYSSSETSIATIDNDGAITLVADGQTVIKAEFAGNNEYEAAAVQYTLTVKPAPVPAIDVTVAEALAIIEGLEEKATTEQTYNVTGEAHELDFQRKPADNTLYGNVNFVMADEQGNPLTVFRCKNIGNKNFTEETISDLKEGDKVIVCGQLQKYMADETHVEPQLVNCYLVAINPESGISAVTVNVNSNAAMYNLAGQKVNANYKGVVIQNGKKFIVK